MVVLCALGDNTCSKVAGGWGGPVIDRAWRCELPIRGSSAGTMFFFVLLSS